MPINEKQVWQVSAAANPEGKSIDKPAGRLALVIAHSFQRTNTEVRTMTFGGLTADNAILAINSGDTVKENAAVYFWTQDTIAQYVGDTSATAGTLDILFNEGTFAGTEGIWGYVWLSAEQNLSIHDQAQIAINGNDGESVTIGPASTSVNGDYLAAAALTGNDRNFTWSSAMTQLGSANSGTNSWTANLARSSATSSGAFAITLNNGNTFDRVLAAAAVREAGAGGGGSNLATLGYLAGRRRGVA